MDSAEALRDVRSTVIVKLGPKRVSGCFSKSWMSLLVPLT